MSRLVRTCKAEPSSRPAVVMVAPPASLPPSELEFISWGNRPRYPAIAHSARLTGVVVFELLIGADGLVVDSRP